jgi:hypothetical protein
MMYLNFIQIIVLVTLLHALSLKFIKTNHLFLIGVVGILFLTELLSLILLYNNYSLSTLYSLSFILHNGLWLIILIKKNLKLNFQISLMIAYFFICFSYVFYLKGKEDLNFNIFIFGSIIYLFIYLFKNTQNLRKENLIFFQSNYFLLISSPVIFLIGLSMLFSFKSNSLNSIKIFGDLNLYNFFIFFVNIIYYSLINLYIYKERKLKND